MLIEVEVNLHTINDRQDTAALIAELTGVPLPDAAGLSASTASAPQPAGDTWDDDPDN